MIKLTITGLVFCYVFVSVIIILVVWIISGYRSTKRLMPKDIDCIWKCSVCLNTYVDSKHEDISVCPLCGSYNKREEGGVK